MLLQMLSTLCSNAARPVEPDERELHVLVSGPLQARGGAGRAAHAVALGAAWEGRPVGEPCLRPRSQPADALSSSRQTVSVIRRNMMPPRPSVSS